MTLTTRQVAGLVGVTHETITRWWQCGMMGFPAPDFPGMGNRWHRWHVKTINRWLDRRGGRPG